jgi:RecB family exonuclease
LIDYKRCFEAHNIDSAAGRVYSTPDGVFPSITTINSAMKSERDLRGLQKWRDDIGEAAARKINEDSKSRGEAIHKYCEACYDYDANPHDIGVQIRLGAARAAVVDAWGDVGLTMAKRLAAAARKHVQAVWVQEVPLWHPELRCAGRADGVGIVDGRLTIYDYKTSRKTKKAEWITDYFLQTSFYALAHNRLFNTSIEDVLILITVENADAQVFTGKVADYEAQLRDRIEQYHAMQQPLAA